eukprot:gnl/Dysnectes_brevis/3744_a4805_709.p1 GENE.gnl/Dysnectes_brevis/3744_a4805_709~~gnl/Dysnectes_brevis/3744_a4805_709.p1  ORF type:complete len:416 (-),score=63.88 gnl/Dysnectes_brevis/3744_a4805_709:55-1302(-)
MIIDLTVAKTFPEEAKTAQYAIITLVMKTNEYVSGASVLAHSIKLQGTSADILCMVTKEYADAHKTTGMLILEKEFTHVVIVPEISHKTSHRWKRFAKLYSNWLPLCFTKIQMLSFDRYEKMLFLDADMLCHRPIDQLFTLPCPAGTLTDTSKHGWPHSMPVPFRELSQSVQRAYGMSGACWLLQPDPETLRGMIGELRKVPEGEAYGRPNCNAGPDEQLVSTYFDMPPKPRAGLDERLRRDMTVWTNIGREFNCVAWLKHKFESGRFPPMEEPRASVFYRRQASLPPVSPAPAGVTYDLPGRAVYISHFVTEKPWHPFYNSGKDEMARVGGIKLWPDYVEWYEVLGKMRVELMKDASDELVSAIALILPPIPKSEEFVTQKDADAELKKDQDKRSQKRRRDPPRRDDGRRKRIR